MLGSGGNKSAKYVYCLLQHLAVRGGCGVRTLPGLTRERSSDHLTARCVYFLDMLSTPPSPGNQTRHVILSRFQVLPSLLESGGSKSSTHMDWSLPDLAVSTTTWSHRLLISSEYGTYKTAKARFQPWLSLKRPETVFSRSFLARNRGGFQKNRQIPNKRVGESAPGQVATLDHPFVFFVYQYTW